MGDYAKCATEDHQESRGNPDIVYDAGAQLAQDGLADSDVSARNKRVLLCMLAGENEASQALGQHVLRTLLLLASWASVFAGQTSSLFCVACSRANQ